MKFAVIGDIHSNKPALQATLDDIKNQNIDFISDELADLLV